MRRRVNREYYRKGKLLKRIFKDDGSYETIPRTFRYTSEVGAVESQGQLMSGFMHTDTANNAVKAITDLKYNVGDKVILDDGGEYEIIRVVKESFNELGRIRGIRRSAHIIFIS